MMWLWLTLAVVSAVFASMFVTCLLIGSLISVAGKILLSVNPYYQEDPPLPPLVDDRVAMMLGLVPDKRTPEERLCDAIRTNGESLKYRYDGKEQGRG